MRIYIFRSETRRELRAFSGDPAGSKLPQRHGPWTATGVVAPDRVPPHKFPRHAIEKATLRRALEGGLAGLNFYQGEVQRFGNVGVGQLTGQHGLHHLHAGLARDLLGAGQSGFSAAFLHAGAHRCALFHPLCQGLLWGHRLH